MLGLGCLGLGETEKATIFLQEASEMNMNHQGVQIHLPMTLSNEFSIIHGNKPDIAFSK
jgi:hypothetical protein